MAKALSRSQQFQVKKSIVIPAAAKRSAGIHRRALMPFDESRSCAASRLVRDDAVIPRESNQR
jgi:hypothetical protein